MRKVLYICHGHPDLVAGGAEIFAYELFKGVRESGQLEPFSLGRTGPPGSQPHIGTPFLTVTGNTQEILYYTDHFDYFFQSQRNTHHLTVFFDELLRALRPDLVP